MRELPHHYIDGEWTPSIGGRRHEVIDPATEEPCAAIMLGCPADVERAVAAARRAFPDYAATPREQRIALLRRIAGEYRRRTADFARVMAEEMGAPLSFAAGPQVAAGLSAFMATIATLEMFAFTETHNGITLASEPIGVVGMITPWNWPLNQIALKVAPALAAGNTMVLKPSEECPTGATIFAEVLDAAGVPAGVFNLVHGDGPTTGAAIAAHPGIEMVSFTGSTRAGIAVAIAAAPTVKRVHQELGGKAANLVLPDADFATVLPGTVSGVLSNSGQSCIAPTRILVPREREREAAAIVAGIFGAVRCGDPLQEGRHLGPLAHRAQFDKVQELIESAIAEGARLETGGPGRPPGMNRGFYVRPTVFSGVGREMRIAREETFGPVATLMPYASLDEAVEIANDTPYGLSAVISGDPEQAAVIAPRLRAGMVTINGWSPTPGAPFGGVKQSGNGREGGVHGLREFMELKAITGLPA